MVFLLILGGFPAQIKLKISFFITSVPGVLLLSKFLSAFVHSSSFAKPSQELFSSSLRAVTFFEIKKGECLNFSGLILVERYNDS